MSENRQGSANIYDTLIPSVDGLELVVITGENGTIHIHMETTSPTARCPSCHEPSTKVRSHYERDPRDIPWAAIPVQLHLHCRRFECKTAYCPQEIFCERIPDLLPLWGRRTNRFTEEIATLGWGTNAEDCAKIATKLGLPVSPDTVLRILMATPDLQLPTPRVLGVDDFAWRKGHTYGTILVDLETHIIVDLLPDRKPETFTEWLKKHPGVEIISRDRASGYAKGAREGAPNATQVADRYHLLGNLGSFLERLFRRVRKQNTAAEPDPVSSESDCQIEPPNELNPATAPSSPTTPGEENRKARFDAINELKQTGMSLLQIAKTLHLTYRTVLKYAKVDSCPQRNVRRQQSSILDPYLSYIRERMAAGCHKTKILFAELQALGYDGSMYTLGRWLASQRQILKSKADIRTSLFKALSPSTFSTWLLWPWERLSSVVIKPLDDILQKSQDLRVAFTLTHQFHTMVRHRAGHALNAWMKAATNSGITELQRFVKSIQKDLPAVYAGLTLPWSQGTVEGYNNQLKLIKRQMYGRSKFELMRKRVLHAP